MVLRKGNWRCTTSHEYVFQFSRSDSYFCNAGGCEGGLTALPSAEGPNSKMHRERTPYGDKSKPNSSTSARRGTSPLSDLAHCGRNRRSVWKIATKPYLGAHFATFPPDLIRPIIAAGQRRLVVRNVAHLGRRSSREESHGGSNKSPAVAYCSMAATAGGKERLRRCRRRKRERRESAYPRRDGRKAGDRITPHLHLPRRLRDRSPCDRSRSVRRHRDNRYDGPASSGETQSLSKSTRRICRSSANGSNSDSSSEMSDRIRIVFVDTPIFYGYCRLDDLRRKPTQRKCPTGICTRLRDWISKVLPPMKRSSPTAKWTGNARTRGCRRRLKKTPQFIGRWSARFHWLDRLKTWVGEQEARERKAADEAAATAALEFARVREAGGSRKSAGRLDTLPGASREGSRDAPLPRGARHNRERRENNDRRANALAV